MDENKYALWMCLFTNDVLLLNSIWSIKQWTVITMAIYVFTKGPCHCTFILMKHCKRTGFHFGGLFLAETGIAWTHLFIWHLHSYQSKHHTILIQWTIQCKKTYYGNSSLQVFIIFTSLQRPPVLISILHILLCMTKLPFLYPHLNSETLIEK